MEKDVWGNIQGTVEGGHWVVGLRAFIDSNC